jgi:hypothetical protein
LNAAGIGGCVTNRRRRFIGTKKIKDTEIPLYCQDSIQLFSRCDELPVILRSFLRYALKGQ